MVGLLDAVAAAGVLAVMDLPAASRAARAWRIVVAGAGLPSLVFGLAVKAGVGDAADIVILDPRAAVAHPDGRAYALSGASVDLLRRLGLWDGLSNLAQPIREMRITDSRLGDAVRQTYLRFGGETGAEPLAHMMEARPLAERLAEACRDAGVRIEAGSVDHVARAGSHTVASGQALAETAASLVVAADGARSRLRDEAGLGWVSVPYRQSALVGTIGHAHDHAGVAIQHFLPAGPFAILPLPGSGRLMPHRSSIVWTERADAARRLIEGPQDEMAKALAARFGPGFGEAVAERPLRALPLAAGLARSFVAPRLVLLGDAAHEIHPLAGQGLNLGLADAAALADRVVASIRLGLDPGRPEVLRDYERARRPAAVALAALTDGLNRLFSTDAIPVRALRDIGLGLVDASGATRGFLGEAASGRTRVRARSS